MRADAPDSNSLFWYVLRDIGQPLYEETVMNEAAHSSQFSPPFSFTRKMNKSLISRLPHLSPVSMVKTLLRYIKQPNSLPIHVPVWHVCKVFYGMRT